MSASTSSAINDPRLHDDTVLRGGHVLTLDKRSTTAEAISIRSGRIGAIGTSAGLHDRIGPATRVIELGGRTVMPGLIDGHAHLDREGLKAELPSLAGLRSIEELVERLRALAAKAAPGEWIVTMPLGEAPEWRREDDMFVERRMPDRHDLDRASTNHPILIRCAWGYWSRQLPLMTIANSAALELAGIGRDTKSPSPKLEIERDARGEPTGRLLEFEPQPLAEFTLFRHAPHFNQDDRIRTLTRSMQMYNAVGTTGVFEGHGAAPEVLAAWQRIRERDRQTVRGHLVFSPSWGQSSEDDVRTMLRDWLRWLSGKGLGDEWLRMSGLYTEIDDSPESRLRASCSPRTGWAGFCYDAGLSREAVKTLMIESARAGIRVSGVFADLLELYSEVDRDVPIAGQRWVIAHQISLTHEQIARIRDMGVVVTTHTSAHIWKRGAELMKQLGPGRENELCPIRSMLEAGVTVSLGTDNVPITLWNSVWNAVSRIERKQGAVLAPDQRITREQALRCATNNGAYLCFAENDTGSLEPGKLADLLVLEDNPLTMPEEKIRDIAPRMTISGGKIAWNTLDTSKPTPD